MAKPATSAANGSAKSSAAAKHVNQANNHRSGPSSSSSSVQKHQSQRVHSGSAEDTGPTGARSTGGGTAAAAKHARKVASQQAVPPHGRRPGAATPPQHSPYTASPHVPVNSAPMGAPPGLASRVVGPSQQQQQQQQAGAVAAAVVGPPLSSTGQQQSVPVGGDGGGAMGVGSGGFCAFCGGRLVAATANFCTYCGQPVSVQSSPILPTPAPGAGLTRLSRDSILPRSRMLTSYPTELPNVKNPNSTTQVIRSPPDPVNTSLAGPNTAGGALPGGASGAHQPPMSRAVGGAIPSSAAPMSATAPTHAHGVPGHPGPVGGGRGGHHQQHLHHPQHQRTMSAATPPMSLSGTSSPSSLAHDLASLAIGTTATPSAAAAGGQDLGGAAAPGGCAGSSGALPFFAQFRGSDGDEVSGDMSDGDGIAAAISAGGVSMTRSVSETAAPGAKHCTHVRGSQGVAGAAVGVSDGCGDGGSSTLGGILGTGLGSLGGDGGVPTERVVGNKHAGGVGDAR